MLFSIIFGIPVLLYVIRRLQVTQQRYYMEKALHEDNVEYVVEKYTGRGAINKYVSDFNSTVNYDKSKKIIRDYLAEQRKQKGKGFKHEQLYRNLEKNGHQRARADLMRKIARFYTRQAEMADRMASK